MFKKHVPFFALALSITLLTLPESNAQNSTTAGPPGNSTITATPTPLPCPEACPPGGPPICARNNVGLCRRFGNQCMMNRVNCRLPPNNRWTSALATNCGRGGRPRRCLACVFGQTCPPQPEARPVCLIDRRRRLCRLVANNCEWDRANCEEPRGAWDQNRPAGCRGMQVGSPARRCRRR